MTDQDSTSPDHALPEPASSKPASPPATLKGLGNRLKIKSKMVRKIAIMDLIKRHDELDTAQVVQVLTAHLEREDQPALQLRVVEFIESHLTHAAAALPVLEKLVADEATDAQVKTAVEYAIVQLKS